MLSLTKHEQELLLGTSGTITVNKFSHQTACLLAGSRLVFQGQTPNVKSSIYLAPPGSTAK